MPARSFGVSTHLFHEARLCREHLVHIAAHRFDAVEVFATRAHFDYRDERAIAQLGEWLSDAGLTLHSMHAPIMDALKDGKWVGSFSNASANEERRKAAIAETQAALQVAATLPFRFLVVHLGTPPSDKMPPRDNERDAARRSVEEIVALAAAVNVKVALEVIPNPLSSAASLVRLIEEDLDGIDVGICLDYGHAHIMGDLAEAIETLSGHLVTTHVHDNRGKQDDHLVPFGGGINWDMAIMETQKIGYDDALMFEVADTGDPLDVLRRSEKARDRLERAFITV
ncbi:MAG: sugar phosphate isomerase/epimerase [Acidimicrobiia bacterium]|nr:sugar phosphate isomerase/epimerase [Acidimicrobiia bacterium]